MSASCPVDEAVGDTQVLDDHDTRANAKDQVVHQPYLVLIRLGCSLRTIDCLDQHRRAATLQRRLKLRSILGIALGTGAHKSIDLRDQKKKPR